MTISAQMTGSHEQRETLGLIGSDKIEGTNVYRSNSDKIGEIERVMLERSSAKVAYETSADFLALATSIGALEPKSERAAN
jgi:hypothetical protein